MSQRAVKGLVVASLLAATAAGAADDADQAELARLRAAIVSLIGEAPCANLVHCRTLALGSRPCGGPAEYLAYSSIAGHREELETKAYEYSFLQEDLQRGQARAGACTVLHPPAVRCVDNHCRLAPDSQ
jgi:hypothetical protein